MSRPRWWSRRPTEFGTDPTHTVLLPPLRIDISTVWELASKLGDLLPGHPVRVVDGEQREVRRGEEKELSATGRQFLAVYVGHAEPAGSVNGITSWARPNPNITATLHSRGRSPLIAVSDDADQNRIMRAGLDQVARWLQAEGQPRRGWRPAVLTAWALGTLAVALGAVVGAVALVRAGSWWLLALPAVPLVAVAVGGVLVHWGDALLRLDEAAHMGVAVKYLSREDIALARAGWRRDVRVAVLAAALAVLGTLLVQVLTGWGPAK